MFINQEKESRIVIGEERAKNEKFFFLSAN